MKVTIVIDRGQGNKQLVEGKVIDETNSHFKVTHETNKEIGEWFAKKSDRVQCYVKE